jgi:hypothetical protein
MGTQPTIQILAVCKTNLLKHAQIYFIILRHLNRIAELRQSQRCRQDVAIWQSRPKGGMRLNLLNGQPLRRIDHKKVPNQVDFGGLQTRRNDEAPAADSMGNCPNRIAREWKCSL